MNVRPRARGRHGAAFIQTQAACELKVLADLTEKLPCRPVRILGGILMPKPAGIARWMNPSGSGPPRVRPPLARAAQDRPRR